MSPVTERSSSLARSDLPKPSGEIPASLPKSSTMIITRRITNTDFGAESMAKCFASSALCGLVSSHDRLLQLWRRIF
jgi:hypothetical protein